MRRLFLAAAFALGATAALGQTDAATAPPSASDILFDAPQMGTVPPGAVLTYRYRRQGSDPASQPAIDDTIVLTVEPGDNAENRTVRVNMLSGANHRAAGPFEDVAGNPVLVLFLEHHLAALAPRLGANPRYLKNAIRAGLRDKAAVTAAEVEVDGERVPGWRVQVSPFTDDPNKPRLQGLDTLRYTFLVSDRAPGAIVSIAAVADAPGGALLAESLTYDGRH